MAKKKYTKKEIKEINFYNEIYWYLEHKALEIDVGVDTLLFYLLSDKAKKMTEDFFKSK